MGHGRLHSNSMTTTDPFELNIHGAALLSLVAESVRYAAERGEPLRVLPTEFPHPLQRTGASFVTLKKSADLRGCIGSLEATEPLVVNVASNAHGAVARDSRFPTVQMVELYDMKASVSVLSPLSALPFADEADLLRKLRPGVDGLVISNGKQRSTFLPQVWEYLPDPVDFLSALKRKGGFDTAHLASSSKAWRYEVSDIGPISLEIA